MSTAALASPALSRPAAARISAALLARLVGSTVVAVAAFDLCFWNVAAPGFSVAVFFALLWAAVLVNRPPAQRRTRETLILLALGVGALAETVVESGFTNILVLLVLTVVLAGQTSFVETDSKWGRWLAQGVALLRAPGRVVWLGWALVEAAFSGELSWLGGIAGSLLIAAPALVLLVIFGSLLASGNAVFGAWTGDVFTWLWAHLTFDIEPARLALWIFALLAVLPLLRPVQVASWWWSWTQHLPRVPDLVPHRAALASSAVTLAAMNGLFLLANAADLACLWGGSALPRGVTYASYVHEGVNTLIFTVVLSAGVLVMLFQQTPAIAARRVLQVGAYLWIAQNIALLVSVARRLKLYIDAYDMTVERLGVIIFLVLVAAGYAVLTLKIARCKSLSWLVGGCVVAVFTTFYVTQFLNLAGWTAEHNVTRWSGTRPARWTSAI